MKSKNDLTVFSRFATLTVYNNIIFATAFLVEVEIPSCIEGNWTQYFIVRHPSQFRKTNQSKQLPITTLLLAACPIRSFIKSRFEPYFDGFVWLFLYKK